MKKFYQSLLAKNKLCGSTLVELLVVVAVLALLASIAIPGVFFLQQHMLNSELHKLQIICHLLQKQAISKGQKQYLNFNSADQSYFYNHHFDKLNNAIHFNFLKGVSGPPANPKKPINQAITFPKQKITFYPNGMISPGTVYLTDQKNKNMSALTIPVSQVSFVRKYKFKTNNWVYLP